MISDDLRARDDAVGDVLCSRRYGTAPPCTVRWPPPLGDDDGDNLQGSRSSASARRW